MKNSLISLLIVAFIISAAFFIFEKNCSQSTHKSTVIPGSPSAIGYAENPTARTDWEFNRLRDPETNSIPKNIRKLELAFAKHLPKATDYFSKNLSWTHRGPFHVGGRTRGAAIDVANENIMLAGGVSGGMWRSENSGASWTKTSGSAEMHNVTCLTQDTRTGKTNNWYIGTGEGYGASASATGAYFLGNGLYKSTDNGLTWNSITSTASGTPETFDLNWDIVWNIALDPSNAAEDEIYAACYGSIYRSADGGTNWTTHLSGGSYFSDVAVTSTGTVYATLSSDGTYGGVWRSDDGINWTEIQPTGVFPLIFDRIVIGINPSNENEVYFLGVTPGYGQLSNTWTGEEAWHSLWKYTYISGDGSGAGGAWTDLSANIPNTGISSFDRFYAQGSYDLVVKVKPDEPNVIFIGGTNLYRSTDGFTSPDNTKQIGGYEIGTALPDFHVYPNHHPDQHSVFFLPSDNDVMFTATDGGIHRTNNCLQETVEWISLNNGYYTTQIYTLSVDDESTNDILLAGFQDNGNYFTNTADPLATWTMPLNGDGSYSAITNAGSTYYLSIQNGKTYKVTLDGSGTPTAFARIDPIGASGYQFINQFTVDPNNSNLMYMPAGWRLYRNDSLNLIPLASNYDSISTGWTYFSDTSNQSATVFSAVAASKIPANIVYAGTSRKKLFKITDAHTGDPDLVDAYTYSFPNGYINCIAVDPRDANKVIVVFTNYKVYSVWYTKDGGENWSKVAGNLEETSSGGGNGPSCRWASILPVGDSTIYFLGTSTGLYVTNTLDSAHNTVWYQLAEDIIGNNVVEMVKTRESDGLVVVATHGNGIFSTHVTSYFDIFESVAEIKNDFQCKLYPNPANDLVNIEFAASRSGTYRMSICDLSGKIMKNQSGKVLQGNNAIEIGTSCLKNGHYLCKIEVNGSRTTSKIIIKR